MSMRDFDEYVQALMAACEATGRFVYKFDSPNNQCSHLPTECRYEMEVDG